MNNIKTISITYLITILYTMVVILSCTVLGHIFSETLGVYWLTFFAIVSAVLILLSAMIKTRFIISKRINLIICIYFFYYIYTVVKSSNQISSYFPLIALVICAYLGSRYAFDIKMARKCIESIALIACVLLLVQIVVHTLFGEHIQMLPTFFLTEEQQSYISAITTGVGYKDTFYRPSSIFLEPSHLVQFVFIALLSCLFRENGNVKLKEAMIYTVGIVFTVSSTGILMALIAWGFWALSDYSGIKLPKTVKILIISIMGLVFFAVALNSNSTLGLFAQRILPSNLINVMNSQSDRYWSMRYLNSFNTIEWMFGRGFDSGLEVFATGFVSLIYKTGIVGLVLYILIFIKAAFQVKGFHRYVALGYVILLFGAEADVFRYILYYATFTFAGYAYNMTNGLNTKAENTIM